MDITGIAQAATAMADTSTDQAIGIAVLRKALNAQTAVATEMLNALPPVQNLPPHLGQNINTTA